MKATGIVRRIDDLGRIVIPKEIRRTLRIRESDPLEIYTGPAGEVIFKKYSPIGELAAFAADYAEVLNRTAGISVIITDRDRVVAAAGVPRREWLNARVSPLLERVMDARRLHVPDPGALCPAECAGEARRTVRVAAPIVSRGDVAGCVVFLSGEHPAAEAVPAETELKLAGVAAALLSRQLEE
ncbi:MAG: AbrB/MazE/SpoVT family DNA-binding domain-containing protein [Oscillospiraceae bacterium]|nr:AbrB/MazE/SpoVT family DNA-binding domain-containing protein [Oscillospiraceae bacterium]